MNKEDYIEILEDYGITPESCGLTDSFESCSIETLRDLAELAEEADDYRLPAEAYDPDDQRDYGRFSQ